MRPTKSPSLNDINQKSLHTDNTKPRTYFQPQLSDGNMPEGLYSFNVFVKRKELREWMCRHGYKHKDYTIHKYRCNDIEEFTIIDGYGTVKKDKKEFIEEREKLWEEKKGTLIYGIDLKFFSITASEPKKLEKRYKLPLNVLIQVAENFPTIRIEEAISRYLQKTSTNLSHYESLAKNRQLADNLTNSRTSFCGIGTRKTKIRLNKLATADVPMAKILRTALEIEDMNITAKKSSYFYSQKIYREKETMLADLAELCRKSDIVFGIQRTNNHSTSFILYFEIPDAGQISFHTNAIKSDWPVYQGTWDGLRNSTLGKIEKAIMKMFKEYNVKC